MTLSRNQTSFRGSFRVALWWALAAALAACVERHDPQGSDTASNWLRACDTQSDCKGDNRCMAGVCTFDCSDEAGADTCDTMSPNALCLMPLFTPAFCELACSTDETCADFRAGYVCALGVCRPGVTEAGAPPTPNSEVSQSAALSLAPRQDLIVSDPDLHAGRPVVEWLRDHWQVTYLTADLAYREPYPAIRTRPSEPVDPRLFVTDVARDGSITTRSMIHAPEEQTQTGLVQGGPGRVGYLTIAGPRDCVLRLFSTTTPELLDEFGFDCGDRGSVAPLPNTDDWLVTFFGATSISARLQLGRYRLGQGEWLAGPWNLETYALRNEIAFAAIGEDAWFAWGESTAQPGEGKTALLRVAGAAAASPVEPVPPLQVRYAETGAPTAYQALSEVPGGALMFYTSGGQLLVARSDQSSITVNTIAPASGAGGSSGRYDVGALRVAELGRTFVCYPGAFGDDGVEKAALVAVDDEGRRIGEPIELNAGGYMMSCALAWSGDALLAVWLDFAGQRNTSNYSMVRGRIVSVE